MRFNKTLVIDSLAVALLCAILFSLFAGSYHLISPDEGRYVEIAREMLAQHQFITPYLNGTAFLDKPILYYWIESFFIHAFGLNEWAARLLPISFATFGCIMNYIAGNILYNRRTGWLSASILFSSIIYFASAHYADMDLMVAVLISISLWLFLIAMQFPSTQRRYSVLLWLAYIFAALAFLTKGLMGIVFPMMIIGCWILGFNNWKLLLRMRLVSGLLLFALIVMPWFVLVQKQNSEFLNYFFIVQQFTRYVGNNFNMQNPLYFYPVVIIVGLFPWTFFLFQACIAHAKYVFKNWRQAQKEVFILLWPLLILIFFSIPHSKIVGYILPVFPPLAVVIARYLDQSWEKLANLQLKIIAGLYLVITIASAIAMDILLHKPSLTTAHSAPYFLLTILVLLIGSLALLINAFYFPKKVACYLWIFTTITCLSLLVVTAGTHTFQLNTVKPLAKFINKHKQPGDKIMEFFRYDQELPVYVQEKVYVVADWNNKELVNDDNWERELAEDVIYKNYRQPYLLLPQELKTYWSGKNRIFLLLRKHSLDALKEQVQPVILITSSNNILLVSNKPLDEKPN